MSKMMSRRRRIIQIFYRYRVFPKEIIIVSNKIQIAMVIRIEPLLIISKINKIILLRIIPTVTFSHLLTGKSSGILFGISSVILSGKSSGILSGIFCDILSNIPSNIFSGILSGISHEVRQGTLGVDIRG